MKCNGLDLIRGIITAYEVQVNLVKAICLHEHKIDHIAHLGPSVAAGIGSMLKLKTEIILLISSVEGPDFFKSILFVIILFGVSFATFSISIPPSVLLINAIFDDSRSTKHDK